MSEQDPHAAATPRPAAPPWALPSAANTAPLPAADAGAPENGDASRSGPTVTGAWSEPTATPAGSAGGGPAPSGVPLLRRKALVGAAGAGAAVLLVGAGFLAGTQFGHQGDDTTRLVSDQSAPRGDGYGSPFGQGGQGGQGGQVPDGDGDGDHGFGRDGAALGSVVAAGRITAIGDSKLTLSTLQGATATITVTSSTTVGGTSGGDLSGLEVGQTVLVAGTRTGDGTYAATAIVTPPSHGDGGVRPGQGGQDGQGGQLPGRSET